MKLKFIAERILICIAIGVVAIWLIKRFVPPPPIALVGDSIGNRIEKLERGSLTRYATTNEVHFIYLVGWNAGFDYCERCGCDTAEEAIEAMNQNRTNFVNEFFKP